MRIPTLLLCFFSAFILNGQHIFNETFTEKEGKFCPGKPGQMVQWPVNWKIYQTQNDNWNGPVDTTTCISVGVPQNGYMPISLDQITLGKPLFCRLLLEKDTTTYKLLSNSLYEVIFYGKIEQAKLITGNSCAQDVCSGAFVGISIPDSNGVERAETRFHTGINTHNDVSYLSIQACFPAEKFEQQFLKEMVLKFTIQPDSISSLKPVLYLGSLSIIEVNAPALITQVLAKPASFNGQTYNVSAFEASDKSGFGNYLLPYTASSYPSVTHPSYVEARPEPNISAPATINLISDPWSGLEIQPFTYFRGALVMGSDTIRHTANLVNAGSDLCLNYIDLVFEGGDEYRHAGGQIIFNNPFSCMQFRKSSALRVMQGVALHYGREGTGMLALCPGGGIVLEHNATLTIDAVLNIAECHCTTECREVWVDLNPGSVLKFTQNALLTNRFSDGQSRVLKVRMLGGSIDDSALDETEKHIIERVWPVPSPKFKDNIQLSPNPFYNLTTLQYLANQPETVQLQWIDLNGKGVKQMTLEARQGLNEWSLTGPEMPGIYFLNFMTNTGNAQIKAIQIR